MRRTIARLLTILMMAALLPASGCDKSDAPEYDWPEQSADGCPVAIEFVEMVGEGEDLQAKLRVFNFSDTRVEGLSMTLHYLNEAGEELDTFPWGANSPSLAAPNGVGHTEAGAFLPEGTTEVSATIEEVRFNGGTTWSASE